MQRDWPKHPEDQFDYYQEQKHGIVEIFVTLRLPVNAYELAAGLYRIADFKSFDDYFSDCVMNDLDMMCGGEVADDLIISKIKGEPSPWMKEQKEHGRSCQKIKAARAWNLNHIFYYLKYDVKLIAPLIFHFI